MYRDPALKPLSREHHFALIYGRRLQGLADAGPATLRSRWPGLCDRLGLFWERSLAAHFRAEEACLPWSWLAPSWRVRLLEEHAAIEACVRRVRRSDQPQPRLLRSLGEWLVHHARWEEQTLFREFQDAVPAAALLEAGRCLGDGATENELDPGWLPDSV